MKKYLLSLFIILLFSFAMPAQAAESTPQFFATWKADTYTPLHYRGKALPTSASRITLSFELVDNGTVVDLSRQTVRWYYGKNLIDAKNGLQTVSVKLPEFIGGDQNFRIEIPNLKDRVLTYSINVPVVPPEAVIEWPSLGNALTTSNVDLHALPYFFNVADTGFLNFSWQVNGKTPVGTQSPDTLSLALGSGANANTSVQISLKINNPQSLLEKDENSLELIYSPRFGE